MRKWTKRITGGIFGFLAGVGTLEEANRLAETGTGHTKTIARQIVRPYNYVKKSATPHLKKFGEVIFLRGIVAFIGAGTLARMWKKKPVPDAPASSRGRANAQIIEERKKAMDHNELRKWILGGTASTSIFFPKTILTTAGLSWIVKWGVKKWNSMTPEQRTEAFTNMRRHAAEAGGVIMERSQQAVSSTVERLRRNRRR